MAIISAVRTGICSSPLPATASTATHRISGLHNVLVELRADGLCGHGYVCAFTAAQASGVHALVRDLATSLLDRDTAFLRQWWLQSLARLNFVGRVGPSLLALAAIDTAAWDLHARVVGLPVHYLLGARCDRVPVYATGGWLDLDDDALVEEALACQTAGYGGYKMKVGGADWRADLRRVNAVRAALHPDTPVFVDANQAWNRVQAIQHGLRLQDVGVGWLEEPVDADDLVGQAGVCAALQVPVTAGETVFGVDGVTRLINENAADIVMLDLARCGGPTGFLRAASAVTTARLPLTSHTFTDASARLLAATDQEGLVEHVPGWWDQLFTAPPRISDGRITLGTEPGFGSQFCERARSTMDDLR